MEPFTFVVLVGQTGNGKTRLLAHLDAIDAQVLDLEHIAGHRGSAFGTLSHGHCNASQQDFLAALSLKCAFFDRSAPVFTEWKGKNLGSLKIPESLYTQLLAAPKILIVRSKAQRIQELLDAYADLSIEDLYQALFSLRPRLGERFEAALQALKDRDKSLFVERMLSYYDNSPEYRVSHHPIVKRIDWTYQSTEEITMEMLTYYEKTIGG